MGAGLVAASPLLRLTQPEREQLISLLRRVSGGESAVESPAR
jgi:hypothetical protein